MWALPIQIALIMPQITKNVVIWAHALQPTRVGSKQMRYIYTCLACHPPNSQSPRAESLNCLLSLYCVCYIYCIYSILLYIYATMAATDAQRRANNAYLQAAMESAMAAGLQNQPANTKKTYKKPQQDWKVSLGPQFHPIGSISVV
jgi:hypothetical protein